MPNGQIALDFGDAEHVFNIAVVKCAIELEEKCDAGIAEIYGRLRNQTWKLLDVRETLRLGLIGGGKPPADALNLVRRYFDGRPWGESVPIARAIMLAAIVGVPGDPVGKGPAEQATRTQESSAPPFTAVEQPSASLPDKSTS